MLLVLSPFNYLDVSIEKEAIWNTLGGIEVKVKAS